MALSSFLADRVAPLDAAQPTIWSTASRRDPPEPPY